MPPIPDSPAYQAYATINENAGLVLQNLRKSRGESQTTLAYAIGYSQDSISRMERGRRDISYYAWERIAAHYHKDLKALLLQVEGVSTLWDAAKDKLLKDKA